jgi:predicted nucleic acid-binding protein
MAVVVDASAIAAIMFGEPESATLVAHLADETLLAPTLIDYELTNLTLKKARRQPEMVSHLVLALRQALSLPISRIQVPGTDVFVLATTTGLTAYDASYLWIARSRDIELVTLDRRLGRAAGSVEV